MEFVLEFWNSPWLSCDLGVLAKTKKGWQWDNSELPRFGGLVEKYNVTITFYILLFGCMLHAIIQIDASLYSVYLGSEEIFNCRGALSEMEREKESYCLFVSICFSFILSFHSAHTPGWAEFKSGIGLYLSIYIFLSVITSKMINISARRLRRPQRAYIF